MTAKNEKRSQKKTFQEAAEDYALVPGKQRKKKFTFILFISGTTEKSSRAVRNVKELLESRSLDNCELSIVDIYQQPELVKKYHVLAIPVLVRTQPTQKRFVGDLTMSQEIFSV